MFGLPLLARLVKISGWKWFQALESCIEMT